MTTKNTTTNSSDHYNDNDVDHDDTNNDADDNDNMNDSNNNDTKTRKTKSKRKRSSISSSSSSSSEATTTTTTVAINSTPKSTKKKTSTPSRKSTIKKGTSTAKKSKRRRVIVDNNERKDDDDDDDIIMEESTEAIVRDTALAMDSVTTSINKNKNNNKNIIESDTTTPIVNNNITTDESEFVKSTNTTNKTLRQGLSSIATTSEVEGRENGLFHFFKHTRLTPIPVQFVNDNTAVDDNIVRPEPIRYQEQNLKEAQVQVQEEEEEEEEKVGVKMEEIVEESSSLFYNFYFWFGFIYICSVILSSYCNIDQYSNGKSSIERSIFSKALTVNIDIAKYEYVHWFQHGTTTAGGINDNEEYVKNDTTVKNAEPIVMNEEEIVWIDDEKLEEREITLIKQRKMIESYKKSLGPEKVQEQQLNQLFSKVEEAMKAFKRDGNGDTNTFDSKLLSYGLNKENIISYLDDAKEVFEKMKESMENLKNVDKPDKSTARDAIISLSSVLKESNESESLSLPLNQLEFSMSCVLMHIQGEGCNGKSYLIEESSDNTATDIERKSLLGINEVIEATESLSNDAHLIVQDIIKSKFFDQAVIEWFFDVAADELNTKINTQNISELTVPTYTGEFIGNIKNHGNSSKEVEGVIDRLLEREMADTTARYDFASIGNGAKVIRSGSRNTSRSLVENLPLLNRVLAKANLRFYGHGAEAALIPTFPKTALGQCWSFEEEGYRKPVTFYSDNNDEEETLQMEPDRGEYATLSVSLSRAIKIDSIIVEHPSILSFPNTKDSAIRHFRLIGFIDKEATGNPWPLGEFEYKAGT